jgi:LmbE family N-acetylglucosaminyl deacetylase
MNSSTSAPLFTSDSRLMLVAPHPDDEALACSVILQRAVRDGSVIHVVYATDGDDNPWPQRVLEGKWRLEAADRRRWGKLRRAEALAALQILGVHPSSVHFLALPDQGLTDLLTSDSGSILERFATSIRSWAPTDLLVPSIHDTHPDHSALAVMLRLVLAKLYSDETSASVWAYTVHGKSKVFFGHAQKLRHSNGETSIKEKAIRCHKTQLKLSRRRFLAYALRPECFLKLKSCQSTLADGSIRWISRQPDVLRLRFALSTKLVPATQTTIFVLGRDAAGQVRCVRMRIPVRSSTVEVFDCHTREPVCVAQYRGSALAGEFAVPLGIFSPAHALFAKVERRSWFFDEAGWLEVAPVVTRTTPARIARTQSMGTEMLS